MAEEVLPVVARAAAEAVAGNEFFWGTGFGGTMRLLLCHSLVRSVRYSATHPSSLTGRAAGGPRSFPPVETGGYRYGVPNGTRWLNVRLSATHPACLTRRGDGGPRSFPPG